MAAARDLRGPAAGPTAFARPRPRHDSRLLRGGGPGRLRRRAPASAADRLPAAAHRRRLGAPAAVGQRGGMHPGPARDARGPARRARPARAGAGRGGGGGQRTAGRTRLPCPRRGGRRGVRARGGGGAQQREAGWRRGIARRADRVHRRRLCSSADVAGSARRAVRRRERRRRHRPGVPAPARHPESRPVRGGSQLRPRSGPARARLDGALPGPGDNGRSGREHDPAPRSPRRARRRVPARARRRNADLLGRRHVRAVQGARRGATCDLRPARVHVPPAPLGSGRAAPRDPGLRGGAIGGGHQAAHRGARARRPEGLVVAGAPVRPCRDARAVRPGGPDRCARRLELPARRTGGPARPAAGSGRRGCSRAAGRRAARHPRSSPVLPGAGHPCSGRPRSPSS